MSRLFIEYLGRRPAEEVIWTWNGQRGSFLQISSGKKVMEALSLSHYQHYLRVSSEFQPLVPTPNETNELSKIGSLRETRQAISDLFYKKASVQARIKGLAGNAQTKLKSAADLEEQARKIIKEAEEITSEVGKGETEIAKIDKEIDRKQSELEAIASPPQKRKKRR